MTMGTEPGPEVAEGSGVTVTLAHSGRPAEPGRPADRSRTGPRWPQHADVLSLAYYVLAGAALAAAGYPAWRVASLGLPAMAQQVQKWIFRRYDPRTCAKTCA